MKLANFKWILFQDNWKHFLQEHAEKKTTTFPFLETKPIYPKTFLFRNSEISFFEILLVTVNRKTVSVECMEKLSKVYSRSSESSMHNTFLLTKRKQKFIGYWPPFRQIIFKKADFRQHTIMFSLLLYMQPVCVFISLRKGSRFCSCTKETFSKYARVIKAKVSHTIQTNLHLDNSHCIQIRQSLKGVLRNLWDPCVE